MSKRALRIVLTDRPLAYHPILARVMDGVSGGVWLGQILYWDSVKELQCRNDGKEYDGWFYKSEREIVGETALTTRECRQAKVSARESGIIEAVTKGLPPTAHYRVNYTTLEKLIEAEWEKQFTDGGKSIPRRRPNNRYNSPSETTPRVPENTQESIGAETAPQTEIPSVETYAQKQTTHLLKDNAAELWRDIEDHSASKDMPSRRAEPSPALACPRIEAQSDATHYAELFAKILAQEPIKEHQTAAAKMIQQKWFRENRAAVDKRLRAYRNGDGEQFRKEGASAWFIYAQLQRDLASGLGKSKALTVTI